MTINNRHVGIFILIQLILIPFTYQFIAGEWFMFDDTKVNSFLEMVLTILGWLELGIIGLFGAVFIVGGTGTLIQALLEDEITFEWRIGGKKRPKTDERDLFIKLGQLDQDSPEWKQIYNELDKKGKWG